MNKAPLDDEKKKALEAECSNFEEALKTRPDDLLVREKTAYNYAMLGREIEAERHYQLLAGYLMLAGSLEKAGEIVERLLDIAPDNLHARDMKVDILLQTQSPDAVAEAMELANLYRKKTLFKRARDLLLELRRDFPLDTSVLRRLANTYLEMGDSRAAVDQLRNMAEQHTAKGMKQEAQAAWEEILGLDPDDRGAKNALREMGGKAQRWLQIAVAAAGALLALVAGYLVLSEYLAASFFRDEIRRAEALARQGELAGAEKIMREALLENTASSAHDQAREALRKLRDNDLSRKTVLSAERVKKARELAAKGDILRAVETLEKVEMGNTPEEIRKKARKLKIQFQKDLRNAEASLLARQIHLMAGNVSAAAEDAKNVLKSTDGYSLDGKTLFPVLIKTIPPGAAVYINGLERGTEPVTVEITVNETVEVRLEKRGFEKTTHVLSSRNAGEVVLALRPRKAWTHWARSGVSTPPAVCGEKIAVVAKDGWVYLLDSYSGKVGWSAPALDGPPCSPLACSNGSVLAAGKDGALVALNLSGGDILWKKKFARSVRPLYVTGSNGFVLVMDNGTCLFADAGGTIAPVFEENRVDGTAIAENGIAVSSGKKVSFYACSEGSLEKSWTVEFGRNVRSMICDAGKTCVSMDGYLSILDNEKGERLTTLSWNGFGETAHAPVIAGDLVLTAGKEGVLRAMHVPSGKLLWDTERTDSEITGTAVSGGTAAIAFVDGRVAAVSLADGTFTMTVKNPSGVTGPPVFLPGKLIFTDRTGKTECLILEDTDG